jgi:tripartite-type tricarboxylate transporter receptor subunit TctC
MEMRNWASWSNIIRGIMAGAAVLVVLGWNVAYAQTYPVRPVTVVVPFAPGTVTDLNARQLAQYLQSRLGQPFVVENRAGANGMIGAASVANARPDGYTLLIGGSSTHSTVRSIRKSVPYDPLAGFTPISRLFDFCSMLVINSAVPAETIDALLTYIRANPTKVEFGYSNAGGLITSTLLRREAGVDFVTIAYRSNPQALSDLIAGHIKMLVVDLSLAQPQIEAGKIRAMAVNTKSRNPLLPNVPTSGETFAHGQTVGGWAGLFGPPHLPSEVIDVLTPALQAFSVDPEMNRQLRLTGTEPAWVPPREMPAHLAADITRFSELAEMAGIKPE